jgi:glycosyltransferase involved in cell wall biosynthesis
MMKVCIISRGDLPLFPPTQGASVKLFYTMKTLSELGIKIYFVTAENEYYFEVWKGKFKKKNFPSSIAKSPIQEYHKALLFRLGIPNDIFVLYHPLINFKLWLKLLHVVLKEKIDLIQAEFTAFGIPAIFIKLLTHKPVVLVEHNVESFQLPEVTKLSNNGKRIVRLVEKFACNLSDRVVVMCKEEKEKLCKIGVKEEKITIIPHGVDLKLYKNLNPKKIRKKYKLGFPTLLFHGTFSYKPNYDAIKRIAKEILPDLKKRGIKVKVLAIGNFPPKDIKAEEIIFTGPVRNLQDYIAAGDIAIVPIEAGGGIRMKILEYFAAKKPVISTPKGIEGIPAKNEREAIIANIEEFPKQIVRLIKYKKLRKKLEENAFKFVQNYDWKDICQEYVKVYKELLKFKSSH